MKNLILFSLSVLAASSAWSWEKVGQKPIVNPGQKIQLAEKQGLGISNKEKAVQSEILALKKKKPKAFEARLEDSLANQSDYQGHLMAARDGMDKVNQARVLAKMTVLEAVRENKAHLEGSLLNRNAAKTWEEFEYYLKRDINSSTVYMKQTPNKEMVFQTGDWGRVTIASNLRTASYHLDVMSYLDLNRLEPGADKIKTDQDMMEPMDQEQAPLDVVPMAAPSREELLPQLRKSGP